MIARFSPANLCFTEFKSKREMEICEKILAAHPLLGSSGTGDIPKIEFSREFDMTNDSKNFVSCKELERHNLLTAADDIRDPRIRARLFKASLIPLFEGRSFHQFNPAWGVSKYFLNIHNCLEKSSVHSLGSKLVTRLICRNTDTRTVICSFVPGPCVFGHNVAVLHAKDQCFPMMSLLAQLNSFVVDFYTRAKGLLYLSFSDLYSTPMAWDEQPALAEWSRQLAVVSDPRQRLRIRVQIDAVVAEMFNLSLEEFSQIVSTFPLVDSNLPSQERQTTLSLMALKNLKEVGPERFCQEGWRIPDHICYPSRPSTEIWEPEGGWSRAWQDAREMLTDVEWKEFVGGFLPNRGRPDVSQLALRLLDNSPVVEE
jgi:hypothetical protein